MFSIGNFRFNKALYQKTWVPQSFLKENLCSTKVSTRKLKLQKCFLPKPKLGFPYDYLRVLGIHQIVYKKLYPQSFL